MVSATISEVYAQGLGPDRVSRAKESVARILIAGQAAGTGFIVSSSGHILTCWHVIAPRFMIDSASKEVKMLKVEAELVSGEIAELGIHDFLLGEGNRAAVGYDYCLMEPTKPLKSRFSFLKLGSFENVNEGDQIYTVGYPLGIQQQVISSGILSTKWIETVGITGDGRLDSLSRTVAWVDLTMNRGNSGGPIIKLGKTPVDDEVVGIATFILNPFAADSKALSELSAALTGDFSFGGISQVQVNMLLANAIANNSVGISGCIAIDHFMAIVKKK